jgi:putative pyruvate formate lyase activating enzyme
MPAQVYLSRAALHLWEEPPISGQRGSGTVFFTGCPLQCVFCQNDQISRGCYGAPVTEERLRAIFYELIGQGAHNINLVSPTHYAHVLRRVLQVPLPVPVVWNTGGYEKKETLQAMEGLVDIYLPDLKYVAAAPAERYSAAPDYPEVAKAAILEMYRQTGPVVLENGLMKRGILIRHLVLPGQLAAAKEVMDWVAETFPPGAVLFSLMSQYVPYGRAAEFPEINRALRKAEGRKAAEYMADLGLAGFTQEESAASTGYIPTFDLTGV